MACNRQYVRVDAITRFLAVFFAGLVPLHSALAAAVFQLERVTPREMYMAPGTSARYVLRIRNIGDEVGIAPLFASFSSENRWDPYTLTQSSDARCGTLHPSSVDPIGIFTGPGFETAPITPGGSLDCAMTITRPAGSPRDTSLAWIVRDTTPPNTIFSAEVLIGTLADTSIATQNLAFSIDASGIGRSTVELTVHNGGYAIISAQIAGACEDNVPSPFAIDGSGPNGCGAADSSPGCFDRGYGFWIPQLASGQTHRCLIHLQSLTPYETPLRFAINLDFLQAGETGGTLMDIDQTNNAATLLLGPESMDAADPVPIHDWLGFLALGSLLSAFAARHLRIASR